MSRKTHLRLLPALIVASAVLLLAGCRGLRLGNQRASPTVPPAVSPTAVPPTVAVTVTPTPFFPATGEGTVPRPTATAGPHGPSTDLCDEYLEMFVTVEGREERAVVTSYRCGSAWIDSTGQSPPTPPVLTVERGAPIQFRLGAAPPPETVEIRLYGGGGAAASFLRWPEELPTGIEPLDAVAFQPGTSYAYIPRVPPGTYSLVMRATWADDVDVFYATSFLLSEAGHAGTEPTAAVPGPTVAPTDAPTPLAAEWAMYTDRVFAISLQYPAHWQLAPGYEGRRYEGADGFFAVDAIGSAEGTIDEVAAGQAGHKLRPYGSQPTIEPLQAQGQEGRLILPSLDANMGGQAMLIARYPQPVEIGGATYSFFALYADQDHVRSIAQTLRFLGGAAVIETGTPSAPTSGRHIVSFQVTPGVFEPGDTVTLSWEAAGVRASLCPSARYVLFTREDCQQVPLSGTTAFTIPPETAGFPTVDFRLEVEVEGAATPEVWQVSVARRCPRTWFYSDEPQAGICPTEPIRSYAAAQRFERGKMIWLEQIGRYVILEDAPLFEGDARKRVHFVVDPLEIVRDTSGEVVPPEGLHAPQSGFGLVWRGDVRQSPGYREALGWALGPEFGYEAAWQCDDASPSGGRSWRTCVLLGPDGEVIVLHPLGGWQLVGEEVTGGPGLE